MLQLVLTDLHNKEIILGDFYHKSLIVLAYWYEIKSSNATRHSLVNHVTSLVSHLQFLVLEFCDLKIWGVELYQTLVPFL